MRAATKRSLCNDFVEPEEEIRDDQMEIERLLEETKEKLSAESREKEGPVFAASQEDSLGEVFKELNISQPEGMSKKGLAFSLVLKVLFKQCKQFCRKDKV